jgi:hypothetical protein
MEVKQNEFLKEAIIKGSVNRLNQEESVDGDRLINSNIQKLTTNMIKKVATSSINNNNGSN